MQIDSLVFVFVIGCYHHRKKLDIGNHTGCSRGGPGGDHGDDVDSVHGVHGVHVGQGVHGGQGRWLGLIND